MPAKLRVSPVLQASLTSCLSQSLTSFQNASVSFSKISWTQLASNSPNLSPDRSTMWQATLGPGSAERRKGEALSSQVPPQLYAHLPRCSLGSSCPLPPMNTSSSPLFLTQHVRGVDLQNEPAVPVLFVRPEDGEDGALLPRLRQEAVDKDRLLGEGEGLPGLPFVRAVPGRDGLAGDQFSTPAAV